VYFKQNINLYSLLAVAEGENFPFLAVIVLEIEGKCYNYRVWVFFAETREQVTCCFSTVLIFPVSHVISAGASHPAVWVRCPTLLRVSCPETLC
jgi:hypothetical protein